MQTTTILALVALGSGTRAAAARTSLAERGHAIATVGDLTRLSAAASPSDVHAALAERHLDEADRALSAARVHPRASEAALLAAGAADHRAEARGHAAGRWPAMSHGRANGGRYWDRALCRSGRALARDIARI